MKPWMMFLALGVAAYLIYKGLKKRPPDNYLNEGTNPLVSGSLAFVPLSQQLRERFLTSPTPTSSALPPISVGGYSPGGKSPGFR